LGHLAGAEAGNACVALEIARHLAERFIDIFGGNIDDQFAGAFRIENRAVGMVVIVVVIVFMVMLVVVIMTFVPGLIRCRILIVFEGISRTQRCCLPGALGAASKTRAMRGYVRRSRGKMLPLMVRGKRGQGQTSRVDRKL